MYTSRCSKEFFLPLPSHWELLSQSPKKLLLAVFQAIPTVTLLLWNKPLKLVYSCITPILWFEGESQVFRVQIISLIPLLYYVLQENGMDSRCPSVHASTYRILFLALSYLKPCVLFPMMRIKKMWFRIHTRPRGNEHNVRVNPDGTAKLDRRNDQLARLSDWYVLSRPPPSRVTFAAAG